jgi:hypothetical protein
MLSFFFVTFDGLFGKGFRIRTLALDVEGKTEWWWLKGCIWKKLWVLDFPFDLSTWLESYFFSGDTFDIFILTFEDVCFCFYFSYFDF